MLSSSSSVAFSSSAARAIEVHSSRHCISSSAPSLASLPSSPSSLGGSCSSAFSASKRAIRSRSFSCIAIDHSAFQPSACICRMATSCMNIWLESSARGRMSSSSARAASSCAPKSSFAGGNVIVGMPAPRAERCDGSVVRLMLILGTLTGGTGAARALESPLMPPPSRSLGTTGAPPEGFRAGGRLGESLPRGELCGGDWPSISPRAVLASSRRVSCCSRAVGAAERARSCWELYVVAPVEVPTKKSCTARSVPSPVPAPDMKSSRVRGV